MSYLSVAALLGGKEDKKMSPGRHISQPSMLCA